MSPNVSNESSQLDFPISMVLTEFHLVLLYNDRIAAISILNEGLAYEEFLPLVSTTFMAVAEAHFLRPKETRGDGPSPHC